MEQFHEIINMRESDDGLLADVSIGGKVVTIPVPPNQRKLAASGCLRYVRIGADRITFVDRDESAMKMESSSMAFTKNRDDVNSTVPTHRSGVDLSNTLIKSAAPIRHVMKVPGGGEGTALTACPSPRG